MQQVKRGAPKGLEEGLVQILQDSFGDDLDSVVIYGSYLRAAFAPGVSDVNVLVVLGSAEADAIRTFGRNGRRFLKRHKITPLILARQEFLSSADVFPMEYYDIVERHKLLHGRDVTKELSLRPRNLRHEVEHQLRGSLVSLRQLLAAMESRRVFRATLLKRELLAWYGSVAAVLRGLLRLKKTGDTPEAAEELIRRINESYGLEGGPFLTLVALRQGGKADVEALADSLVERLTRLVQIVDQMETGADGPGDAS